MGALEHGRVEGIRFGSRAERHFLRLANALLTCTTTIIWYLQEISDPDERESLQTSLIQIAGGINAAVHHPLRNILYASLELLDIVESEDLDELRFISSTQKPRRDGSTSRRGSTATWRPSPLERLVKEFLDRSEVLATLTGDAIEELRASLTEDDTVLRERYFAIPRSERLRAWRIDFTRAWLDEFADELAFQDFYGSVQDRQTDVP